MDSITMAQGETEAMRWAAAQIEIATRDVVRNDEERCADRYRRARDLPRLVRIAIDAPAEEILEQLRRALRAEQNASRTGHWSRSAGDIQHRCIALRGAILAEERALEQQSKGAAA